ncbi:hypothetical protein [Cryobacterium aureum]|nr:hypothetical protein [Cryobacterium aureum]
MANVTLDGASNVRRSGPAGVFRSAALDGLTDAQLAQLNTRLADSGAVRR